MFVEQLVTNANFIRDNRDKIAMCVEYMKTKLFETAIDKHWKLMDDTYTSLCKEKAISFISNINELNDASILDMCKIPLPTINRIIKIYKICHYTTDPFTFVNFLQFMQKYKLIIKVESLWLMCVSTVGKVSQDELLEATIQFSEQFSAPVIDDTWRYSVTELIIAMNAKDNAFMEIVDKGVQLAYHLLKIGVKSCAADDVGTYHNVWFIQVPMYIILLKRHLTGEPEILDFTDQFWKLIKDNKFKYDAVEMITAMTPSNILSNVSSNINVHEEYSIKCFGKKDSSKINLERIVWMITMSKQ